MAAVSGTAMVHAKYVAVLEDRMKSWMPAISTRTLDTAKRACRAGSAGRTSTVDPAEAPSVGMMAQCTGASGPRS
jgi:hypothetical protein